MVTEATLLPTESHCRRLGVGIHRQSFIKLRAIDGI